MADFLHCSPETIINNIINWLYAVQNEKFEIKNKKMSKVMVQFPDDFIKQSLRYLWFCFSYLLRFMSHTIKFTHVNDICVYITHRDYISNIYIFRAV